MLINTHLILADKIYSKTTGINPLKICKRRFIYGNIKPDIDKEYRNYYHSSDYALETIEKIFRSIKENFLSPDDFSERLGIINHFVCDMFCSYHNDEKLNRTLIQHLLYESKLHLDIKSNTYTKNYKIDIDFEDYSTGNNLSDLLIKLQARYYELLPSPKKDINFSLMAGSITSKLILSNCIENYINIYEFAS